jgi:hypothetical protein
MKILLVRGKAERRSGEDGGIRELGIGVGIVVG